MTKAERFVQELNAQGKGNRSCVNAAHRVDSTKWYTDDVDEDYRFYYFSDGSRAGTRRRLRPLQYWVVEEVRSA